MDVQSLSAQQLNSVKKQLDDEIEHLSSSFSKLKAAQSKFNACAMAVKRGVDDDDKQEVLVPLTASLYVPAELACDGKVLLDVGTGFYLEKSTSDAVTFYRRKGDELGKNLKDLEKVIQGKTTSLRTIEELLRQKIIGEQDSGPRGKA